MNTFFINTSAMLTEAYSDLLDVYIENKKLVRLNCLFSDWNDEKKGYLSCAHHISELIDGYVELDNDFQLIFYVDLTEYPNYSDVVKKDDSEVRRSSFTKVLTVLYRHLIGKTLFSELTEKYGKIPKNVLIMCGGEKLKTDSGDMLAQINECLLQGMGEACSKKESQEGHESGNENAAEPSQEDYFCVREDYSVAFGACFSDAGRDVEAVGQLWREISAGRHGWGDEEIKTVFCPYAVAFFKTNKSARAIIRLNLSFYLIKCIERESIYVEGTPNQFPREVMPFQIHTADEFAAFFSSKCACYRQKLNEINSQTKTYSDLSLAPKLYACEFSKFGLKKSGEGDGSMRTQLLEGFPRFDEGKREPASIGKASPEKYCSEAKEVLLYHEQYLANVREHVSDALSNYAGRSRENRPALLQQGEYQYASEKKTEKENLETVERHALRAYRSMTERYLIGCKSRPVSASDIKEQYEWFVARIRQIQDSLSKIKIVSVCLLALILALYIPFFVIQFPAISESAFSFTLALISLAIPVALLYVVYVWMIFKQKKKYHEAWNTFSGTAEASLMGSNKALEEYDLMLCSDIPALRYMHDYVLDVHYYAECCKIAPMKMWHHKAKLEQRIKAIENMIKDLERSGSMSSDEAANVEIDYALPFCSGEKNKKFYAFADANFLSDRGN